jgi:DNA-binding transcriptional LysR family regulator
VAAVREGNGLGYVFEQFIGQDLASGRLGRVLPEHALVREAFFLYYPSRRRLPQKLRVFSDWFRDMNA